MTSAHLRVVSVAAVIAVALAACRAGSGEGPPDSLSQQPITTSDAFFSGETLPVLHLSVPPESMEALARRPRDYVRGSVRFGDHTYAEAGIRLKGHRAMRGFDGKPSFKLHLSKFSSDESAPKGKAADTSTPVETEKAGKKAKAPKESKEDKTSKKRLFGQKRLTLNSMVEDPTMMHEVLGYRLYQALGVPAPRAGYALVYVNEELYGVYANIETIDETFLDRVYEDDSGAMYEGEYGCDAYADDVAGFKHDEGDDAQGRAALAKLAADPLGMIDRERVLGYLAVSAILGDFDGYRHSHNYRIYFEPAKGLWSFIPWGIDRTFKKDLSIYDSGGLIAQRCFADSKCRADYVQMMQKATDAFESLNFPEAMDRLGTVIDAALRVDPRRSHSLHDTRLARAEMRTFVANRVKQLRAQTTCIAAGNELDADGDGYGCLDCNDTQADIHPGANESCDKIDNDCNGLVDDGPTCACTQLKLATGSYELCDLPMSFAEADAFCAARGQSLARVDSREDGLFLYEAAQRLSSDKWWIGLQDRTTEGTFTWQDQAPLTYAGWAKGEPDNDACNQDCAALKEDAFGLWHDTHCGSRLPFICRTP